MFGIVAVAALLRIAWAIYATTQPVQFRDPAAYQMLGDSIAHGDGFSYLLPGGEGIPAGLYPTAYYPPGYPVFLGALYWLFDLLPFDVSHLGIASGANVVLSTLTVPLVFALGRRINGVTAGLVAAAAFALLPNAIYNTGVALTESLFLPMTVLLVLLVVATPQITKAPGTLRLVAIGLLFAATAMVRPVSLLLLPAFVFLWWPESAKVALKRTALVVAGAAVVILPWTVRNAITMDSPVLISANLGDNLCIGYNDDATGAFVGLPEVCDGHRDIPRPRYEILRQSDNLDTSVDFIKERPTRLPSLVFWRGFYTLKEDKDGLEAVQDYYDAHWMPARTEDVLGALADGYYFALGGFALVGMIAVAVRRRGPGGRDRRQGFLLLTMFLSILPPLLTFGDPRFKAPLYPFLAIYAGLALAAAWQARPAPEPGLEEVEPAPDPVEAGDPEGVHYGAPLPVG